MGDIFDGIAAQLAPGVLWRTDLAALARMALVCKYASASVRVALARTATLKERELERRERVREAQRFLRDEVGFLLHDREWTRNGYFVRTRVCVTFNGRIRVRETLFFGRRRRGHFVGRSTSTTYIKLFAGGGMVTSFPWMSGLHIGRFYDTEGLLYGLNELTHVVRQLFRGAYDGLYATWEWRLKTLERSD
jgi:hypothetical protein